MSVVIDALKGIQMPNITTTNKDAIVSPLTGAVVFDTTLNALSIYSGSAWQGVAAGGGFDAGTAMLFMQTTAPTGWTKSLAHDNKALRIVSGTAGSGGTAAFTTAFGTPSVSGSVSLSGTVGATTLTTAQMPAHTHGYMNLYDPCSNTVGSSPNSGAGNSNTTSTGGGGSHTHSFSGSGALSAAEAAINVQYVDVIIATKD